MIKFYVIKRNDLYVTFCDHVYLFTTRPCDAHAGMSPPTKEDVDGLAEFLAIDASTLTVMEWNIEETVFNPLPETERT